MEKNIKFLLIGLVGLLAILGFFTVNINAAKEVAQRKLEELQREKNSLEKKVEASSQEIRRLSGRADSLNMELDRVSREKEDVQKKFELLSREKEELVKKIKEGMQASAPQQAPRAAFASDDAYWGGILKAKAELEMQLGNLRNEFKSIQINNEELQRNKAAMELEVTNLNREKQEIQRQVEYNQKMLDGVSADLARERTDKFNIANDLKAIKSENRVLRKQLSSLNNRKVDLERKLQKLSEDKAGLERSYANMESILKDKVSEICQLKDRLSSEVAVAGGDNAKSQDKTSIDLPPIVVRPQATDAGQPSTSSLTGKVMTVNRDNNFIIIDLGENTGVKAGDSFKVFRQNAPIGSVTVIQVRKDISACDIKEESSPIKPGDIVR